VPASASARERALLAIQRWASRQIQRRLLKEWEESRHPPEVRARLFRRSSTGGGTQVSRSFIQINFLRGGRPD
jgi:hypothetical protein